MWIEFPSIHLKTVSCDHKGTDSFLLIINPLSCFRIDFQSYEFRWWFSYRNACYLFFRDTFLLTMTKLLVKLTWMKQKSSLESPANSTQLNINQYSCRYIQATNRYGLRSQEGLRFSDGYQACGCVCENARYMYKCIIIHLLKLCFNMRGRFRFTHMYLIKVLKIYHWFRHRIKMHFKSYDHISGKFDEPC